MFRYRPSQFLLPAGSWLAAHLSALIVVAIALFVLAQAWPALQSSGPTRFFGDAGWYPTGPSAAFNLAPMMLATTLCALGAVVLAAPLGVLSAICVTEFSPPALSRWIQSLLELMAGIPSVVYGLWGLVTLVPLIASLRAPGVSLLAGIVVLFLMILPTVALGAVAALRALSPELREAVAGLGFSRSGALWHVLLPAARGGIIGAVILGLARALGETMALLMVTGNVVQVPASLLDPVRTLTANIALELAYAVDVHRSSLFVGGLLLSGVVLGLTWLAESRSGRSADE